MAPEGLRAAWPALCPGAVNDNGAPGRRPAPARRAPDYLQAEVKRLQALAEEASLDALAHMLAMAAREAGRVAEWERRVRAELDGWRDGPPRAETEAGP